MTELLIEIQKIIQRYLNDKLNVQYMVAECVSVAPLKFKADRRIILEKECFFTENARKVTLELDVYKTSPDEVYFTGCRGHKANIDGMGTGEDFVIKTVKEKKSFTLQEPIKVGDKCVFSKLNNQYLYIGKQTNPYRELVIKEEIV